MTTTLSSFDPRTGQVLGEVAASSPADVRDAVEMARKAAPEWAALSVHERASYVKKLRHLIHDQMLPLAELISSECGKPKTEALAHDILPALMTLLYQEKSAGASLSPERLSRLLGLAAGTMSTVEYRPYGVVGCISAWNYPFFLTFLGAAPALLAGNTVVVKPSEVTPGVGEAIKGLFDVFPSGVATVIQGGAKVGAALVDAPCDKLCFIGSPATGKKIAAAAAKHLTPLVMELGGRDAAIVCGDADIDIATSGVLWGAFMNAGQTCCAVERVYVSESIAEGFSAALVEKLGRLRSGTTDSDIGPVTVARQLETVERHVDDAVAKGASVLAGGPEAKRSDPEGSLWYPPTVLEGVTDQMDLSVEETFGPVLPIIVVRDEDEAVRRTNEEGFNLTCSIWSRSRGRAERLASKVRAGTVSINAHGDAVADTWAPWGGVGESGYGRLNGVAGIREFAVPVHIARNILPGMKKLWWYPYDEATDQAALGLAGVISAPTIKQKMQAAGRFATNFSKAIRGKI